MFALAVYRDEYTPAFLEWLCAKFENEQKTNFVVLFGLTEQACEIIESCIMLDEDSLQGKRSAIINAMGGII